MAMCTCARTAALPARDADAYRARSYDLMHTLANVVRNFIKMLKGKRAPGAKAKASAAAAEPAVHVAAGADAASGDPAVR
jgi:hypothetical protein